MTDDEITPERRIELLGAALHAIAWQLVEEETDTSDRGVSEEHYRDALERAKTILPTLMPGVVAEEPEWETERVEEARIHYRYGVNSGTLAAWNTPESIALAVEDHERRTMGRVGVEKIETRTKITRTSPWVPVEQEGANDA